MTSRSEVPPDSVTARKSAQIVAQRAEPGKIEEFSEFYRINYKKLITFCIIDQHLSLSEAEDIAQACCLETYRKWESIRSSHRAYAFRIARYMAMDHKEKSRREAELGETTGPILARNRIPTPEEIADRRHLIEQLDKSLKGLTTARRSVVLLRSEGLTFDEIAEILDKTAGAVRGLAFEARNIIRDELNRGE